MNEQLCKQLNELPNDWMQSWFDYDWRKACIDVWIYECMNERLNAWIAELLTEWIHACMTEWMNAWMYERAN